MIEVVIRIDDRREISAWFLPMRRYSRLAGYQSVSVLENDWNGWNVWNGLLLSVVGVIGHFFTTAMMANVVGAEPPTDAPSYIKS